MKKTKVTGIAAVFAALVALFVPGSPVAVHLGGTAGNVPAAVATTSTVAIGPASVVVLFPPTPAPRQCSSRVISSADALWIGFSNTATSALQNGQGFLQVGSTTASQATYSSDLYGCEGWIVRSATNLASSTITITEFRQ